MVVGLDTRGRSSVLIFPMVRRRVTNYSMSVELVVIEIYGVFNCAFTDINISREGSLFLRMGSGCRRD